MVYTSCNRTHVRVSVSSSCVMTVHWSSGCLHWRRRSRRSRSTRTAIEETLKVPRATYHLGEGTRNELTNEHMCNER
jgi:hypothetical protein